jgi:Flp pilus assembly protein TadG
MTSARGQALLELALCAPLVVLLALGAVGAVQVAGARAGLDAATQAAANAAARAPDPGTAVATARERFSSVIADYPVVSPTLSISVGDFGRAGSVSASSSARVELAWAGFLLLPDRVTLRSHVVVPLEPWRTRGSSP